MPESSPASRKSLLLNVPFSGLSCIVLTGVQPLLVKKAEASISWDLLLITLFGPLTAILLPIRNFQ